MSDGTIPNQPVAMNPNCDQSMANQLQQVDINHINTD